MADFTEQFGSMVFNKDVMRQRLSPEVFERIEDIMNVKGIKTGIFSKINSLICVK